MTAACDEMHCASSEPYDGVHGELPDWVPEAHRDEFKRTARSLLRLLEDESKLRLPGRSVTDSAVHPREGSEVSRKNYSTNCLMKQNVRLVN